MYATIKFAHILFVILSILLFEYRYVLKINNKPLSKKLKIIPHLNDSFLLISGISLAIIAGFNPMLHAWLAAKIITLVLYIGFGIMALKKTGIKGSISFVIANALFFVIVYTAISKRVIFVNI